MAGIDEFEKLNVNTNDMVFNGWLHDTKLEVEDRGLEMSTSYHWRKLYEAEYDTIDAADCYEEFLAN